MFARARLTAIAVGAAIVFGALAAHATSHDVPSAYARRELTLPNVTLRLDDGPYWPVPSGIVDTVIYDTGNGHDTNTALNFGFGLGIVKSFELGMHIFHYDVDNNTMADPSMYALWRFLKTAAELGLFVEVTLPIKNDIGLLAGMPVAVHLGNVARIDTGPFMTIPLRNQTCYGRFPFANCNNDKPDFIAPFELPISVSDQVYLGPEFGMYVPDFDRTFFFFGFFAGYTFRSGGGTLGDIGGRFRMPNVDVGMDVFELIFELRFFFDL